VALARQRSSGGDAATALQAAAKVAATAAAVASLEEATDVAEAVMSGQPESRCCSQLRTDFANTSVGIHKNQGERSWTW